MMSTIICDGCLPRIASAASCGSIDAPHSILVKWQRGEGKDDTPPDGVVDLGRSLQTRGMYKSLRHDPTLFAALHILDDGRVLYWERDIGMSTMMVAELATEQNAHHSNP